MAQLHRQTLALPDGRLSLGIGGAGIFMGMFQFGDMPNDRAMRNMELFARKAMPYMPKPAPAQSVTPPGCNSTVGDS